MEIFKDISGYEGLYQVSSLGNIKSLKFNKEKNIELCIDSTGYYVVCLSKEGNTQTFRVHILVAIAFHNHIPDGMNIIVDHKDNDKLNNREDNLQIITQRENSTKDKKGGTSKYPGVSWSKRKNKWRAKIQIKGKTKHIGYFTNELDAAQAYQKIIKEI